MHFARLGFRACTYTWTRSRASWNEGSECGEVRIIRGLVQIKVKSRVIYSL